MPPIVATAEVDRPPADVFAYVTDPARFGEWQADVVSGHLDGGGTEVGAWCTTVRRIGGVERSSTSELVRLEPPRAWAVRGIDGPIRVEVAVTVERLMAVAARKRRGLHRLKRVGSTHRGLLPGDQLLHRRGQRQGLPTRAPPRRRRADHARGC
jgi:hypothetical protein